MVCDVDDQPFSDDRSNSVDSSCSESGDTSSGFLCSDYQPWPVSEELAYGFAITDGIENCCKCYELQWTEGDAAGKRMQVQIINEGGSVENGSRDFVLLTPGGGVGPNQSGCDAQFGYDWFVCPLSAPSKLRLELAMRDADMVPGLGDGSTAASRRWRSVRSFPRTCKAGATGGGTGPAETPTSGPSSTTRSSARVSSQAYPDARTRDWQRWWAMALWGVSEVLEEAVATRRYRNGNSGNG